MARSIDVVVGDVHARADALYALLRELEVIDAKGRRRRKGCVVQVGDLLDRKAEPEANRETARLAVAALDVVLAGNHEWRMLQDGENEAALELLGSRGWPHAAAASGGWLVTHAGVHPDFAETMPGDAEKCAAEINRRWQAKQRGRDPLFTAIGPARGGSDPHGGVLWMHSEEWPKNRTTPWGQIAGHVPQTEPRLLPGPRWAIDIKAPDRLAAIVRPQGERRWRPVVVKAGRAYPVAA
jgi:calcineurin-like phosphoesterase family protein